MGSSGRTADCCRITVDYGTGAVDLALPAHLPAQELIPQILALTVDPADPTSKPPVNQSPDQLVLRTAAGPGRILEPGDTLAGSGVYDGDVLFLRPVHSTPDRPALLPRRRRTVLPRPLTKRTALIAAGPVALLVAAVIAGIVLLPGKPAEPSFPGATYAWPLNDGAGDKAEETVEQSTPATLSGGATWTQDAAYGRTVAALDGTTGSIALPDNLVSQSTKLTLRISFKALPGSDGVLLSTASGDPSAPVDPGDAPLLYIGRDGWLYAQYPEAGGIDPIMSPDRVDDGRWHTAVLVGADDEQTLYLDGQAVGARLGQLSNADPQQSQDYAGAGVIGAGWPESPVSDALPAWEYFRGRLADVVFFDHALTASALKAGPGTRAVLRADSRVYASGSVWYSAKSTMTFANAGLTIIDNATKATIAVLRPDDGAAPVSRPGDAVLSMQRDGNLVIYLSNATRTPLWSLDRDTTAAYKPGDTAVLSQDSGDLVVLDAGGTQLWSAAHG